jgi:hypothetical protein
MSDFVAEVGKWFDAIAVAQLDGFQLYEGDDNCFVLWLGTATRTVAYGPDIIRRGLDACLELLRTAEESEQPPGSYKEHGNPEAY